MDKETGEVNYKFQVSKDAETGEEEYITYCLDQETGEKQYYTLDRICESLKMPNLFKVSRYSTHVTAVVGKPNTKSSSSRIEFMTAIVFLLPTFILFTPILGMLIPILDIILHKWCHKKNAKLNSQDMIYYKSPLHMILKEFCSECRMEEECKKIGEIQNIRNNKRYFMQESLRRVVA
ncbi:uncharacterized protein [Euwallacea fornicatus]|uniref:uncharacterized protein n=1 Tax=Euwallacea fornicatus TaxID=995702 RepID=UPI00338F6EAC